MRDAAEPSVRRTTGHTMVVFAGNGLSTALGFLSSICIMRALGPQGFGIVVVAMTVMQVLWQLTGRGLDQALVRCVALFSRDDPAKADAACRTVHRVKLVVGGLLFLLGLAASVPLTRFFIGPDASPLPICVASAAALAASIWGYTGACLQSRHAFGRYAVVLIANPAVRFAVVGSLFLLGRMTPTLAMVGMGLGFLVAAGVGFAIGPPVARGLRARPDLRPTVYAFSRWLVLSSVIHLLYSRLDQLMLSRMIGADQTGIYGASATFVQLVDLLTASMLTVLLPKTCAETAREPLRRQAWASVRTSVLLVIPMASGFLLADPVMEAILGPEYAQSIVFFKIIFAGALFNMITHPLQVILHACGKTHELTVLDVGLLVASGVCNYVAIGHYGAMGAAVVALLLRVGAGLLLVALVVRVLREAPVQADM